MGKLSWDHLQMVKVQEPNQIEQKMEHDIKDLKEIPYGVKLILLKSIKSLFQWENLKDVEIIILFRQLLHKPHHSDQNIQKIIEKCKKQKKFLKILEQINQLYIDKQISVRTGQHENEWSYEEQERNQIQDQLNNMLLFDSLENELFPLSQLIEQTQELRIQRLRLSLYNFRVIRNRMILSILNVDNQ